MDWDGIFAKHKTDPMEKFALENKGDPHLTMKLTCMNRVGVGYFFFVYLSCFFVSVWITLPVVCGLDLARYYSCAVFITFIALEIGIHYYAVIRTSKENYSSAALDECVELPITMPGAADCSDCHRRKPPRSHHCALCQKCILRRDHHCFFTACCVGHFNQRHFVPLLIYVALGCVFSLYFLNEYLSIHYKPIIGLNCFHYIFPVPLIEWLLGYFTYNVLLADLLFALTFMALLAALVFDGTQVVMIIKGQTAHEFFNRNTMYSHGLMRNIKTTFGDYFLVQFFFPFYCIPLPENGVYWPAKKDGNFI